jgi:hypothetical protein
MHRTGLGMNKNMVMGPDGAWNQEWLYWREAAANYFSAVSPNVCLTDLCILPCYCNAA